MNEDIKDYNGVYHGVAFHAMKCNDGLYRYEIPSLGISSRRGYRTMLMAISEAKNQIDMA